mmetsp:Transcript_28493/g.63592  ORF Transcript_28493/g.63592 Transcript_28493/m.63592 type:complete len:323 (+) Transcript_28493:267-1235(+)
MATTRFLIFVICMHWGSTSAVPSQSSTKRNSRNKRVHSAFVVPHEPAAIHSRRKPTRRPFLCTRDFKKMRGGAASVTMGISVLPAVGVGITNAMLLSAIPPIMSARRRGTLDGGPSTMHLALVFPNCVAWTTFALITGNPYIFLSNGPGVLIGYFLFMSGMRLGTPAQNDQLEKLALGAGALLLCSGAAMGLCGADARLAISLANCFSIAFYLSPLPVLREALRTHSARALQLPMAVTTLVNSALWTSYGASVGSMGVLLPNCLGVAMSCLQLALIFVFRGGAESDCASQAQPENRTMQSRPLKLLPPPRFGLRDLPLPLLQ